MIDSGFLTIAAKQVLDAWAKVDQVTVHVELRKAVENLQSIINSRDELYRAYRALEQSQIHVSNSKVAVPEVEKALAAIAQILNNGMS